MSTSEVVTSMIHKIICIKVANRGEIVLKLPTWILKFRRTFIAFIQKTAWYYIITCNSLFIFKLKKRQMLLQLRVVWNLFFKYSSVVEKSFLVYPSGAVTTAAFNFLEKRKTSLVISENKPVHTRLQQNFEAPILALYLKFWGTSIVSA